MRAIHEFEQVIDLEKGEYKNPKVDSLEKALELAMRTIHLASNTISGKATYLHPVSTTPADASACPLELPEFLADKDFHKYGGYYHTDLTLPSEYFVSDVERPKEKVAFNDLDLTYMFDASLDNPDYDRMAKGRPIGRESEEGGGETAVEYAVTKRRRGIGVEVDIENVPRLSAITKEQ